MSLRLGVLLLFHAWDSQEGLGNVQVSLVLCKDAGTRVWPCLSLPLETLRIQGHKRVTGIAHLCVRAVG